MAGLMSKMYYSNSTKWIEEILKWNDLPYKIAVIKTQTIVNDQWSLILSIWSFFETDEFSDIFMFIFKTL